jgi:hypothetical protein
MKFTFLNTALAGLILSVSSLANAGLIYTDTSTNYDSFDSFNTQFISTISTSNTYIRNSNFENLALLNTADSVWGNGQYGAAGSFSALEIANLTQFISNGKKAVFITDNGGWSSLNRSIEQIIGASIIDTCDSSTGTAITSNPLTQGVGSVSHRCGSNLASAPNAELLFSNGLAGLYDVGLGQALVITSVDQFRGSSMLEPEFAANISTWLDTPIATTDVPEPSTLAIFALGMIGLASRRFKKQS